MELQLGQEVYFARGFKDRPRAGVIVRDVGSFYIGTNVPDGINYVTGYIEQRRRDAAYPLYDKFMVFDKREVLACHNDQAIEENYDSLAKDLGVKDIMKFDTASEAERIYELLRENHIQCDLRGLYIENISNPERAEELIQKSNRPKRRALYRPNKVNIKDDFMEDDMHMEI